MKYVLALWALPLGLFWGWYFVSLNDMNFGYIMLSRQFHDIYFQVAGQITGLDPAAIPAMVARACIIDTMLLLAICAFRRRRQIIAWVRDVHARYANRAHRSGFEADPTLPAE